MFKLLLIFRAPRFGMCALLHGSGVLYVELPVYGQKITLLLALPEPVSFTDVALLLLAGFSAGEDCPLLTLAAA